MTLLRALREIAWLRIISCLIGLSVFAPAAFAQTPTAEQLEVFRRLPADQQRSLLETIQTYETARTDQPLATPTISAPAERGASNAPLASSRLDRNSTVLVIVEALADAEPVMVERRDRILAGNPYRLDYEGRLELPFVSPIAAGGLTVEQTAQRLNADPRLAGLTFQVTLLPVQPVGSEALEPFGYDMFDQAPTTFAPATDIPVPVEYRVGPGDNVVLELFGNKSGRYSLVVDRSGALLLPELGPLQVTGLSFDQVRSEIEQRLREEAVGVQARVTLGQLRSIRVFIVGDVARPGTYTVSGLSTVTNALFASGGISRVGSLRNVELKRGGATLARLDLYDLLLRGDTSKDLQLQSGDAIFVAPIGPTVSIAGEVVRPAIYELRGNTTVAGLLQLAGGTAPIADAKAARLERIDQDQRRVVIDLDLTTAVGRNRVLRGGDIVTIPRVLDEFTRSVTLEGHVVRPGKSAWRPGMRLTDLLGGLDTFKLNADQRYVLIRRELMPNRRIQLISADAIRAFAARGSAVDPALQSGDRILVFGLQRDRGAALAELLQELRLQVRDNQPTPLVTISGRVRAPGEYPLEPNMTVADLIRAGGGLDEAAHTGTAEMTRYQVSAGHSRQTEVREIDLSGGPHGASMVLQPYDVLVIKETPDWNEQASVTLLGEVRFPGQYPLRSGETLSSVVARAGGLTQSAYPLGSVFLREEIKSQERQQLDVLAQRLQSDLALLAMQGAQAKNEGVQDSLAAGQSLLAQLRATQPTGRLVVDVQQALTGKPGNADDLELRGGDTLMIPKVRQYVTVVGEVQNATSHIWKPGRGRDDYIALSGGETRRADSKHIYVVRADGSVMTASDSGRGRFRRDKALAPGDTIVVPIDADRMRPLPVWTAVTTVIYNLAVAAAAIASF